MRSHRVCVLCAVLLAPAPVMGQGWFVEVHGGSLFTPDITGGSGSLPPPGVSFDLPGLPQFQSRRVSSWLVGDGASLLNEVATVIRITPRITALDHVANNPLADRKGGVSIGFRVSREITPRFAAELNVDYARTPFEARASASSGLNATTASFRTVWENNSFAPPGVFVGKSVTATHSLVVDGNASEIITTGAIRVNLLTQRMIRPYVIGGAGVTRQRGDSPVATASGGYSFRLVNIFPINESDDVSLTQIFDESVLVGVFGGGVNVHLSQNSGIRGDVRVHIDSAVDKVLLDATPTVAPGTPPTWTVFATNPGISFNSFPQPHPGPPSNLSGPAINDFTSFEVTKTRSQFVWALGYFFRF